MRRDLTTWASHRGPLPPQLALRLLLLAIAALAVIAVGGCFIVPSAPCPPPCPQPVMYPRYAPPQVCYPGQIVPIPPPATPTHATN